MIQNPIETTNRVVWREGALLCPQHLQQQERYLLDRIQQSFYASHPFPWGVQELEIDDSLLKHGEFRIKRMRAMLADGLHISLGIKDPLPESRNLVERFDSLKNAFMVYLGVPLEKPGLPSFDATPQDQQSEQAKRRYSVHSEEVFDQTQEHERHKVQTAAPRSRILFENDSRDDYVCLPIARVVRNQDGYALDKDFIPPTLQLHPSSRIIDKTGNVISEAISRINLLQGHRGNRSQANLDMSARDTGIYMWLFALGSRVPQVRALLQTPNLAPFTLFRELSSMAGQLAALTPKYESIPEFNYDHDDLRSTFEPLFALLFQLINFPFKQSYKTMPLSRRKDGMWLNDAPQAFLAESGNFVLAVRSTTPKEELARRFPELAKLASYSQITGLVHSALRGVGLRDLRQAPETMPTRQDTVYFQIDQNDNRWKQIIQEKNLALYIGAPLNVPDMHIDVLVGLSGSRENLVPV